MWGLFLLFAVLSVAAALLAPKAQNEKPTPSSLGDFQVPTAEEGRPVPVIFGTVKLGSPNVVWYGDLGVTEIKKRVRTGPCSSEDITVGHKYYLGLVMGICMGPVDVLQEIWIGDKLAWNNGLNRTDNGRLYINQPNLFGGNNSEGGVQGRVAFYFGTPTQPPDPYYACKIGNSSFSQYFYGGNTSYWDELPNRAGFNVNCVPAFRNMCYCVVEQAYLSTSNYIKNWAFVVKRIPNNLGLGEINGDANPAEIIYELLTNDLWGLSMPGYMIDVASLQACGTTLENEGCGMSITTDTQSKADTLLQEIIRHVDASLFTDPKTGKLKMKLVRNDYDPAAIPVFDINNVKSVEMSRISWPETYNEVKVNYIDRSDSFQEKVAQAVDLANYYVQEGDLVTQTMDFKGFSNATAAGQAAVRLLKAISYPLAKLTIVTNRDAYNLAPGDTFKLNWSPLGISNMACRVLRPKYGTLEQGDIEIEAIEDVYGIPSAVYITPPSSGWVEPVTGLSTQITYMGVMEAPYYWQGTNRWVCVSAVKPESTAYQYEVWTNETGDWDVRNVISSFTPAGILVNDYPRDTAAYDTTGFVVTGLSDMQILNSSGNAYNGANMLLIGNEIMAWGDIVDNGDGTFTIKNVIRGCLDTIPEKQIAGQMVYFFTSGVGLTSKDRYANDLSLSIKLYPRNYKGLLQQSSTLSITTTSRAWKPYPPGRMRVNGLRYPAVITGNAVVTWSHRNRVLQGSNGATLIDQDNTNTYSPEGTYTAGVKVGTLQVVSPQDIGTATTYTYTAAQRLTAGTDGTKPVRIDITAVNGSYQQIPHYVDFIMTGYGMTYGQYYGGVS